MQNWRQGCMSSRGKYLAEGAAAHLSAPQVRLPPLGGTIALCAHPGPAWPGRKVPSQWGRSYICHLGPVPGAPAAPFAWMEPVTPSRAGGEAPGRGGVCTAAHQSASPGKRS